jgi:hypothetical protein
MEKQTKIIFSAFALIVLTLSLISAMTVSSVNANNFSPGEEQKVTLKIKNTLNESVKEVSAELDVSKVPFIVVSSNEIDEISEDDSENLNVNLKASSEAKAGDYSVPYVLKYKLEDDSEETKTGTLTLTVEANPELSYTVISEKAIIGTQGKIKLTIVNKGFGDAKFVSVKIIPDGYTLLSGAEDYVGTINSDDFETISFDVIFKDSSTLNAEIEYKDFNNQKVTKNVNLPITVYTNEEALKLGLIKPDNSVFYVAILVVGIGIFVVVRKILKKRKKNKSQGK